MDKKSIETLSAQLPEEIIKTRSSAGQNLRYITGSTVIDILNKAFNYEWNWKINEFFIQQSVDKKKKNSEETIPQGPVAHVIGTLSVNILDDTGKVLRVISKDGAGSKSIIGGQSEQESIFKAASTDALKKAASLFGVALELYRSEEDQMYFEEMFMEEVWTPEMKEKYRPELELIKSIRDKYSMDEDQVNEIIKNYSNKRIKNLHSLPPEEMLEFAKYMKELDDNAEAGK